MATFKLCSGLTENDSLTTTAYSDYETGHQLYFRGEYVRALTHFNSAIKKDPDFVEAYNDRGLIYFAMGDYLKAISNFSRVVEHLPDSPTGYNNRAIAYFARELDEEAIVDLGMAIQQDARFAKAYYNRGLIYYFKGGYDLAITDLDKAIEFTRESLFTGPNRLTLDSDSFSLVEDMRQYQPDANLPVAYAYRGAAYYKN